MILIILILSVITLSGCGEDSTAASGNNVKQQTGTEAYQGKDNLAKFEQQAQKSSSDAGALIEAGKSAFVNNDFDKAADYYKKAIAIDPKNVIVSNNLGNVYFRGKNDPKTALPYYKKATEIDPTYYYGWMNLALCQQVLGDKKVAQDTLDNGMQKVPKSDPNYKGLEKMRADLK